MKKKKLAIDLRHIKKVYKIHHEKPTLSESILHGFETDEFVAIHDLSLQINKGEKVGIIGPNGSGKTTLLKIIAGITTPNSGVVKTNGKVISLLDLESGFHPDLNGEENIYLNGLVIGMSKAEIKEAFQKIVEFADIGEFISAPMYTYSQGMKLRLGFSIAVHANPDILILDENISAGDQNFQKKSIKKINEFFRKKKTIVVVTQWIDFLKNNVDRVLIFKDGAIENDGQTHKVLNSYLRSLKKNTA